MRRAIEPNASTKLLKNGEPVGIRTRDLLIKSLRSPCFPALLTVSCESKSLESCGCNDTSVLLRYHRGFQRGGAWVVPWSE